MYQNCCKNCGSIALHTEQKGNNTGLYCDDCGAWIKWLSKDELRAFEYSKKETAITSAFPISNDLHKEFFSVANDGVYLIKEHGDASSKRLVIDKDSFVAAFEKYCK